MSFTQAQAEQLFLTKEQATALYNDLIARTGKTMEEQVVLIRTSHIELSEATGKLRTEVDSALVKNKAEADQIVAAMKEELRGHDEKRIAKDSSSAEDQDLQNVAFESKIQGQVEVVNELAKKLQEWTAKSEVSFTALAQAAQDRITQTQVHIKDLIDKHKEQGDSSGANTGLFRAPAERDRNVFDPRDYKVAELPEKMNLALQEVAPRH